MFNQVINLYKMFIYLFFGSIPLLLLGVYIYLIVTRPQTQKEKVKPQLKKQINFFVSDQQCNKQTEKYNRQIELLLDRSYDLYLPFGFLPMFPPEYFYPESDSFFPGNLLAPTKDVLKT